MGTTANRNYPYPDPTDPADMAQALQDLAEAIDVDMDALAALALPPPMAVVTGNDPTLNALRPSNETAMDYTTVNYDNDGMANLATLKSRLTINTAGIYFLHFMVRVPDVTSMLDAFIRVGGTSGVDYGRMIHQGNAPGSPYLVVSALANLTAGQFVVGTVIQNTATVQSFFTPRLTAYRVA